MKPTLWFGAMLFASMLSLSCGSSGDGENCEPIDVPSDLDRTCESAEECPQDCESVCSSNDNDYDVTGPAFCRDTLCYCPCQACYTIG